MSTNRLYRCDVYLKECEAEIISANIAKDGIILEFDQSVFFPEGGGQSCDIGQIYTKDGKAYDVVDVQENGEKVLHKIAVPVPDDGDADSLSAVFNAGDKISMKINWEHRFDNMQRHCGEHILSGIFYREFGGVNRGFHMGEEYLTIDISLEENPNFKEVTWEMAKHAELCANEVVWNNAPVTVHYFAAKKDAEKFPMRKKLEIEENISIVCIGDPTDPSDSVACCGTHPASAGQVGLIKIWKVEPNKGMYRIYCEAGKRAYLDYEKKHDIITAIGNKYSAGADDLLDKMAAADDKIKATKTELHNMRKLVLDARTADIEAALKTADPETMNSGAASAGGKMLVRSYDDIKAQDVFNIGKGFINKTDKLIVLAADTENTLFLFSDGKHFDCGKLIKDNAHIYNGKGGGKADNARAIFPNKEYLDTFIDLLDKHLR